MNRLIFLPILAGVAACNTPAERVGQPVSPAELDIARGECRLGQVDARRRFVLCSGGAGAADVAAALGSPKNAPPLQQVAARRGIAPRSVGAIQPATYGGIVPERQRVSRREAAKLRTVRIGGASFAVYALGTGPNAETLYVEV